MIKLLVKLHYLQIIEMHISDNMCESYAINVSIKGASNNSMMQV